MSTIFDPNYSRLPNVQPVHLEDQPIGVKQTTQQGVVAANGANAAHTTAATDYVFAWVNNQVVNHVALQNNTSASLLFEVDAATSAGSFTLAAGQIVFLDIAMSALHLQTAAQQNVNGTAGGNIVVRAWV